LRGPVDDISELVDGKRQKSYKLKLEIFSKREREIYLTPGGAQGAPASQGAYGVQETI
jgi:hypothetical protein